MNVSAKALLLAGATTIFASRMLPEKISRFGYTAIGAASIASGISTLRDRTIANELHTVIKHYSS